MKRKAWWMRYTGGMRKSCCCDGCASKPLGGVQARVPWEGRGLLVRCNPIMSSCGSFIRECWRWGGPSYLVQPTLIFGGDLAPWGSHG